MKTDHYRLAGEDDKSYTIHDMRDGSRFKIAKAGTHRGIHSRIKQLPHFDDGGEVTVNVDPSQMSVPPEMMSGENPDAANAPDLYGVDPEEYAKLVQNPPQPQDQNGDSGSTPDQNGDSGSIPDQNGDSGSTPDQNGDSGSTPLVAGPAPASAPAPQPQASVPQANPMTAQAASMNTALQTERNALVAAGKSESDASQKEGQLWADMGAHMDQMKTPEQIYAEHQAQDNELMKAYLNKSIDPDRYWHNKSTGAKIAGGLGIFFSGIGSALTGQPNYALQMINGAVNRDIDAQKSDQSRVLNLWKMNREATQNEVQANLMTQNQMLTAVKAKAVQYANARGTAKDQMALAPLISQIDQQMAQNRYRSALLSSSQVDPTQVVPFLVPPEHQKQALTEIGQAKAAASNEDSIMKAFDQAAQDTRPMTGRSTTSVMNAIPGYHPASVKTLQLLGDPLIHDNEGRINEFEKNDFMSNLPQFGDSDETVAKKRAAMQNFINHKKSAPTANAFGIDLERYASTSSNPLARLTPEQRKYAAWAKANPGNPKAKLVLKKLGIQ